MKQLSFILIVSTFFALISCSGEDEKGKTDYIITEKDLIPEGAAFDPETETIYISSTWKKKIVAIDKKGNISDFISEGQDDIKSVIGMEVDNKRNCLWAVSSEANEVLPLKNPGEEQWRSSVYQFDLSNGKLIKKYPLYRDSVFLNDLTVSEDGVVYISESRGRMLYRILPGSDSVEFFMGPFPHRFVNGLSFTDKPGMLFLCGNEGIFSINISSKDFFQLPVTKAEASGIDGLAFHQSYFIAHQSSKIVRLYLSGNRDSIIRSDTLDSGIEFDASTTGEVSGNYYYYIVNSQIQSGVNYESKTIKPMDSLENIIIRKIKL